MYFGLYQQQISQSLTMRRIKRQMIIIMSDSKIGTTPWNPPEYCVIPCGQICMQQFFYYGFIVSVFFSILTIVISLYNITMHFINFNNPYFQSKIIMILLIPPVFCVTSAASFLSYRYASYITLFRGVYEVVGLFAFFYLIFSFIAFDHQKDKLDQKRVYQTMCAQTSEIAHDCPANYFQKPYQLSNWRKAKYFTHRCKRAILQFIIINLITSGLLSLMYPNFQIRVRDYNDWDYQIYNKVTTYIYWFTTASSYFAYYYMSMYYGSIRKHLRPFKPDLKFITYNSTMFYTYWQKVWMVLFQSRLLACFDHNAPIYNYKTISYNLENVLICFEMFFMALANIEAYNFQDYTVRSLRNRIGSFTYIIKDLVQMFRIEMKLFKPKKFKANTDTTKPQTQLQPIVRESKFKECAINKQFNLEHRVIQEYF